MVFDLARIPQFGFALWKRTPLFTERDYVAPEFAGFTPFVLEPPKTFAQTPELLPTPVVVPVPKLYERNL